VEGSFLALNEASDGYCDISLAAVYQAQYNTGFVRDEVVRAPYNKYVLGQRIRYTYEPDLRSATFLTHNIYYPNAFAEERVEGQLNSTLVASHVCMTLENRCPVSWEFDNFTSQEECVARMDALPILTTNERGAVTADANSTGCRVYHSSLAVKRPEIHCAHLSFFPEEDPHGNVKCSSGDNRVAEDLFGPEDLALFTRAAASGGLDPTSQIKGSLTEADLGTCRSTIIDENAVVGSQALPPNYVCAQYLELQNATGERNNLYWLILVGMLVGIRLLAMFLLRKKAGRN
jgi:hypothetical protein